VLVGANGSFFTTSASAQNTLLAALIRLSDGAIVSLRFADVATDNSTVLLAVRASALGGTLTAASPRFTYQEQHFSGIDGSGAAMPGIGKFNAFAPALAVSYAGGAIAVNGSAPATVNVNAAEWAMTPAQGLMIVAPDNSQGANQARLLPAAP